MIVGPYIPNVMKIWVFRVVDLETRKRLGRGEPSCSNIANTVTIMIEATIYGQKPIAPTGN